MEVRNRRRLQAALIVAIFVVPLVVALVLGSLGWIPNARSYGQPIQPERDLADVNVQLANGKAFAWTSHAAEWTLVALPGPDCSKSCLGTLDLLHRAQIALGRHADKLRLVYLGTPPAGEAAAGFDKVWTLASTDSHALDSLRASARDSVSAVLVTPSGQALTRYPAPIDPARLAGDLKRIMHR
ncbi:MAG TPA: hypothetical protein VFL63_03420 [Rhodanobacteraceae bacterium]|jgi:cytochrome oxidase Cu insertion factor (SCO1/SenC/PrrC family)|nr:hypothetical protein [Rhodanobacteraceae bacterium]